MIAVVPTVVEKPRAIWASSGSLMRILMEPAKAASASNTIVRSGGSGVYGPVYAFAVIGTLAAGRDLVMLRRGGITGVDRTARHLWRMSAAFFIATGSFCYRQAHVLPAAVRQSAIPMVLGLAPLALMAFWLVRVRIPRRRGRALAADGRQSTG